MILTTTVQNTATAEVQGILKKLDPKKDVLLLYGDFMGGEPLNVQYIKPINDIITLGVIDNAFLEDVIEEYGDVSLAIVDYVVNFENGVYTLELEIDIEEIEEKEKGKKNLPFPILIAVGVVTAILTIILVVLKIIKKLKSK